MPKMGLLSFPILCSFGPFHQVTKADQYGIFFTKPAGLGDNSQSFPSASNQQTGWQPWQNLCDRPKSLSAKRQAHLQSDVSAGYEQSADVRAIHNETNRSTQGHGQFQTAAGQMGSETGGHDNTVTVGQQLADRFDKRRYLLFAFSRIDQWPRVRLNGREVQNDKCFANLRRRDLVPATG
jgi:hypothetical protein